MSSKQTIKFNKWVEAKMIKKGASKSSIKTYTSILRNIRKSLNNTNGTISFCKDFKSIDKVLKNKSASYKISAYSAFLKCSNNKDTITHYKSLLKECNGKRFTQLKKGKMSDKEMKRIGDTCLEDCCEICDKICNAMRCCKDKDSSEYYMCHQYLVISTLYFKEKFVPRLDYCSMKVIYTTEHLDDNVNQMLVEDDKITVIFNKFKNVKRLGSKRFVLSTETTEIVREWIMLKEDKKEDYLFYNINKGVSYNNKRFSEGS